MLPGIFLAAGRGKRFGSQKLIYPFENEPLLVRGLRNSIRSNLSEVIVVLGYESGEVSKVIEKCFSGEQKLRIIINKDFSKGMISSFNSGLKILDRETMGVMMILADMPFVSSSTINKLIELWDRNEMIIPEVNGSYTHPRIIPSSLFSDFLSLDQFNTGKDIIRKNKDKIKTVVFENREEFMDIDSKNDLIKFPYDPEKV